MADDRTNMKKKCEYAVKDTKLIEENYQVDMPLLREKRKI